MFWGIELWCVPVTGVYSAYFSSRGAEMAESSQTHVLSALLGFAPVVIGTGVKWLQDHSKTKRRVELSDRLVSLGQAYCAHTDTADTVLTGVRESLIVEIQSTRHELECLQSESQKVRHHSVQSWIKDFFLFFLPHGMLAWLVQLIFYAGSIFMLFAIFGSFMVPIKGASDVSDTLLGFFFLGLCLLGVQRLAIWLHRRYLLKHAPVVPTATAV